MSSTLPISSSTIGTPMVLCQDRPWMHTRGVEFWEPIAPRTTSDRQGAGSIRIGGSCACAGRGRTRTGERATTRRAPRILGRSQGAALDRRAHGIGPASHRRPSSMSEAGVAIGVFHGTPGRARSWIPSSTRNEGRARLVGADWPAPPTWALDIPSCLRWVAAGGDRCCEPPHSRAKDHEATGSRTRSGTRAGAEPPRAGVQGWPR